MKKHIFKRCSVALSCFLLIVNCDAKAQDTNIVRKNPLYLEMQYAGGIGFLSAGVGYQTKNEKIAVSCSYGYLPASIGGVEIHSATAKFSWTPLNFNINKDYKVSPLRTGILVNYSFGKQYFSFDPPYYEFNYYKFPTAFNTAIHFGSKAGYRKFQLYYELLIFDRELISFVSNTRTVDFDDIITLGIGLNYQL